MSIKIGKVTANGNAQDGVRVPESANFEVGALEANSNGGSGLNIIKDKDNILTELGLPENTDMQILSELLSKIKKAPDNESKSNIVKESVFLKSLGVITNSTSLIASAISIASNISM